MSVVRVLQILFLLLVAFDASANTPDDEELDYCYARMAIAPPPVADTLLGDELVAKIKVEVRKRSPLICNDSNFTNDKLTREVYDRVGLTSYFSFPFNELQTSQIKYIATRLKATHLIFVDLNHSGNVITVHVREISEEYSLDENPIKFQIPLDRTLAGMPRTHDWIRFFALLTPNTVTLGIVQTQVSMIFEENYEKVEVKNRGKLPPIISSVGFNKIEHVRNYRLFDYGGSFFPSTFLFAIDQVTTAKQSNVPAGKSPQYRDLSMKLYGACTPFTAQGSLHTPIGTTYAGLGVGPCLYQKRVEDFEPITEGAFAVRVNFGHRVFVSETLFTFFEGDALSFTGKKLYKSDIAHASAIVRATLGLGYYLADVEHIYTDTWHRILN